MSLILFLQMSSRVTKQLKFSQIKLVVASAECVDIKHIDQIPYLSSIKAQELTYGTST